MRTLTEIIAEQQRSQIDGNDVLASQLLARLLEVAEEVCVQRDRVATCITLAAAGKPLTPAAIDQYKPTTEETAIRLREHTEFFADLLEQLGEVSESR